MVWAHLHLWCGFVTQDAVLVQEVTTTSPTLPCTSHSLVRTYVQWCTRAAGQHTSTFLAPAGGTTRAATSPMSLVAMRTLRRSATCGDFTRISPIRTPRGWATPPDSPILQGASTDLARQSLLYVEKFAAFEPLRRDNRVRLDKMHCGLSVVGISLTL